MRIRQATWGANARWTAYEECPQSYEEAGFSPDAEWHGDSQILRYERPQWLYNHLSLSHVLPALIFYSNYFKRCFLKQWVLGLDNFWVIEAQKIVILLNQSKWYGVFLLKKPHFTFGPTKILNTNEFTLLWVHTIFQIWSAKHAALVLIISKDNYYSASFWLYRFHHSRHFHTYCVIYLLSFTILQGRKWRYYHTHYFRWCKWKKEEFISKVIQLVAYEELVDKSPPFLLGLAHLPNSNSLSQQPGGNPVCTPWPEQTLWVQTCMSWCFLKEGLTELREEGVSPTRSPTYGGPDFTLYNGGGVSTLVCADVVQYTTGTPVNRSFSVCVCVFGRGERHGGAGSGWEPPLPVLAPSWLAQGAGSQRIKENLTAGTFRELFPLQVSKDNEKQKGFSKRIEKKKTFR